MQGLTQSLVILQGDKFVQGTNDYVGHYYSLLRAGT